MPTKTSNRSSVQTPGILRPDWPLPNNIRSAVTQREGGCSAAPYHSLNVADHVGDDPHSVAENRGRIEAFLELPADPCWLQQVHGASVADLATATPLTEADAVVGNTGDGVAAIMTADCLPVLFCSHDGQRIGAAHGGWRSLAEGVLENTVKAMQRPASEITAWLGPAIGPKAFEVGDEVRAAFLAHDIAATSAFRVAPGNGKWHCDIFMLARQQLLAAGVGQILGGGICTFSDPDHWFSYRRDGETGRMVSLIWGV